MIGHKAVSTWTNMLVSQQSKLGCYQLPISVIWIAIAELWIASLLFIQLFVNSRDNICLFNIGDNTGTYTALYSTWLQKCYKLNWNILNRYFECNLYQYLKYQDPNNTQIFDEIVYFTNKKNLEMKNKNLFCFYR